MTKTDNQTQTVAKSLGEKLCEAMPSFRSCWGALTDASRADYERVALRFAASLAHDETTTALIEAERSRANAAEAALREGLAICRDMVKAEDDLIAELQAEGKQQEILAIDFPIMYRMRAFVARALTNNSEEPTHG